MGYILYKNPVQLDTLAIVQYLSFLGQPCLPSQIIERNHPAWVTDLPSILADDGKVYIGLRECEQYYCKTSGESNLLDRAVAFKTNNPNYRVNA